MSKKTQKIQDITITTQEIQLPNVTFLIAACEQGFIQCASLNIGYFNSQPELAEKIIAASSETATTIESLLDHPVTYVTKGAQKLGVKPGIPGRQALLLMAKA